jgi:hypothetical protein
VEQVMKTPPSGVTAFIGHRLVARGDLQAVAQSVQAHANEQLAIFDDATGQPVELDLWGSVADVLARLPSPTSLPTPSRGRPKLGVIAREVTLLPRHWEWLSAQPGGASAALRRLVDRARQQGGSDAAQVTEAAYRVMTALAGDLPGYEEATRALFARDLDRFDQLTANWPSDVVRYLCDLTSKLRDPS